MKMDKIIGIVVVILFFTLPLLISRIFERSRLPEEAERILEREEGIVCRYNTYMYSLLLETCFLIAVMCFAGAFYGCLTEGAGEYLIIIIVMLMVVVMFLALSVVIFQYQKNWTLVLFPEGIVFRDRAGTVYCCANEKIVSCTRIMGYRRDEVQIVTAEKKIFMNHYCTNYHEAETFCCSKSYYK